jgi:tetratricopeptide (TPR) repeat protein
LDVDFGVWFRKQAVDLAPDADFGKVELPPDADLAAVREWNKQRPGSFEGLLREGTMAAEARRWDEAKGVLEKALALYPRYAEGDGPLLVLAMVYRKTDDPAKEREMLEKYVGINADSIDARLRLIQLAMNQKPEGDWKAVKQWAQEILAINPLTAEPHRHLAAAATQLKDWPTAIEESRVVLTLQPLDKAQQEYQLAKLLAEDGQLVAARHEVDVALEEAPRFREAHRLLLEIADRMNAPTTEPASVGSTTSVPAASAPAGETRP